MKLFNPPELGPARGYSNGVLAGGTLYVAGQIATNARLEIESDDFVAQYAQALDNVLAVVRAAGGAPESIVRMTAYLTDRDVYLSSLKPLGEAYRARMGRHFPAMAYVIVAGLVHPRAQVEIEATAVLSEDT